MKFFLLAFGKAIVAGVLAVWLLFILSAGSYMISASSMWLLRSLYELPLATIGGFSLIFYIVWKIEKAKSADKDITRKILEYKFTTKSFLIWGFWIVFIFSGATFENTREFELIGTPPNMIFHGYKCSKDCSGHSAGYEWAMTNQPDQESGCSSDSSSFVEGCQIWVREQELEFETSSKNSKPNFLKYLIIRFRE